MFRRILGLLALLAAPSLAVAQTDTVIVTDRSILPNQTVTWKPGKTYVLSGRVIVDEGAVLNIDAGTVIKGMPGQGENASALIVARGGKIYARGTANRPIIFTALADDVTNPNDIPAETRGLWGGVIILGRAKLNSTPGETPIEGIPTTETRGLYGGKDDDDNSGVFRYVSIRHGGSIIGANNEINGLTMGAVGRGTVIEYVEVLYNADDGFEWFGGTVNTRYLVSAFNDDDGFDYDEGFRGNGQYWLCIQSPSNGNMGGEHDGGTTPEDGRPYAIPTVCNATYIGAGTAASNANSKGLILRDNAGGKYYNSLFTDFVGMGLNIEDDLTAPEDSRKRLEQGDILFANNLWWGFGSAPTTLETVSTQAYTRDHLSANSNRIADPQLRGIVRTAFTDQFDPRPKAGSPALSGAASGPADNWFQRTDYVGAFGPTNWLAGWTTLCPVNHAPVLVGSIANQSLVRRGAPFTVDLSGLATDPDGDVLTFMARTGSSRIIRASLVGSTLTVTPLSAGTTTVRVSISDGRGNAPLNLTFQVVVRAAKEVAGPVGPIALSLDQNYPNPFNPSTTVSFSVPAAGRVRVAVYDLLGQQVASLVDANVAAGTHQVEFAAAGLASGTYYCRLETSAGVLTRTMTLVR